MLPHNGLSKLSEECSELAQAASKIVINHESTSGQREERGIKLRVRLLEEIADVQAATSYVRQSLKLSKKELDFINSRKATKLEKFKSWD